MMSMMYGGAGLWGFWGIFMMLVFWGLLGLVVYWAVKAALKSAIKSEPAAAMEVLKTRYAKSEITADEYKRMRDELTCLPGRQNISG